MLQDESCHTCEDNTDVVAFEHSPDSRIDVEATGAKIDAKVRNHTFHDIIQKLSLMHLKESIQPATSEGLKQLGRKGSLDSSCHAPQGLLKNRQPARLLDDSKGNNKKDESEDCPRLGPGLIRKRTEGTSPQAGAGLDSDGSPGLSIPHELRGQPELLQRTVAKLTKLNSVDEPRTSFRFGAQGSPVRRVWSRSPAVGVPGRFCKQLASAPTDGKLVIEVSDSGCGISPEDQKNLFKPFSQANKSIHSKYGGTGLGLWLCDKLIKAMNGTITCTSVLGQGSTFVMTLPLKSKEPSLPQVFV
jgi:hypothetical protein